MTMMRAHNQNRKDSGSCRTPTDSMATHPRISPYGRQKTAVSLSNLTRLCMAAVSQTTSTSGRKWHNTHTAVPSTRHLRRLTTLSTSKEACLNLLINRMDSQHTSRATYIKVHAKKKQQPACGHLLCNQITVAVSQPITCIRKTTILAFPATSILPSRPDRSVASKSRCSTTNVISRPNWRINQKTACISPAATIYTTMAYSMTGC